MMITFKIKFIKIMEGFLLSKWVIKLPMLIKDMQMKIWIKMKLYFLKNNRCIILLKVKTQLIDINKIKLMD